MSCCEERQASKEEIEEGEKEALKRAEAAAGGPIKVSQLLGAGAAAFGAVQPSQDQYIILSKSLLELHNDMRDFRKKQEGMDRALFSFQQGINKMGADLNTRIQNVEKELVAITELWNKAVADAEGTKDATNEEGEEDTGSNEEDVRSEEG